ncbi:MAG: CsbD family protein [Rhodobacteraceae bacterium]|nr:CsbD family protein [Paracoccaceae bacterium]
MDKNRIMGIAKQAEGDVKEQAGKLTENPSLEAAGKLNCV